MTKFQVYQQLHPQNSSDFPEEWEARIVAIGVIDAEDSSKAIDQARSMLAFRKGRGLARFPVVGGM